MSLRKTTILFVVLALAGLIFVLLGTQQITLMPHFDQVEQQIAEASMRQVHAVWQTELSDLQQMTEALGLQAGQALQPTTAQVQRLDWLALLDPAGKVIDLRKPDLEAGQWQPAPEQWVSSLQSAITPVDTGAVGAWVTPDGLALLSVQPVTIDGEPGSPQGWVAAARMLDEGEITRLAGLTQLQLQVRLLSQPEQPESFEQARVQLNGPDDTYLTPLDDITLGGYTRLDDLHGSPVALLEAKLPRFIYRSGLIVKNFQSIALVLSAVIFGATILFVLEGLVLSRIMRLNKEVNQIGQTEDLSGRVTVSMRDEIGSLSRNINQMLENLEQAQLKRAELFEQVQAGQQNLQRLSRQLVDVQEAERRRLALELHDEIGQNLTGLKLMLEGGASLPDPQIRERMRNSLALVNELIGRVRTLSLELRPAMLDDFGLLPTLMWLFDRYTAQTDIQVDFQHNGLQGERFPAEIETAAYRTIQEALTNSARHSGVQIVYVRAWRHENLLGIQLEDHGAGFDLEQALQAGSSSGLIGIRERVSLLGGDFSIETAPGEGTCLTVTFPLQVDLEEMDEHHNSAG